MTRLLLAVSVALTLGLLLVPGGVDALPEGAVGYKLYHYEVDEWVRYTQGDPFPPGGGDPGTNLWKYTYCAMNLEFTAGVYQFLIFFNSDAVVDRAQYVSATFPEGWSRTYFPPVAPNTNWKVRFRTTNSAYYILPTDTLCGFEVEFTWTDPNMPPPQNYDLVATSGSEPGVTHELPPDITPVESTTWGRLKSLFFR
jgi:hypothetical protein